MANENSVTIGKVIPTFKGDWNANTSYSALDVVVHKNITYVAETDILTGTEPKEGTGEWSIMARGAVGPQGEQGIQGIQGPIGPIGPTGPVGPKGDMDLSQITIGGRNYILNSKRALSTSGSAQDTGWVDTSVPISALSNTIFTLSVQVDYDNITDTTDKNRTGIELSASEVKSDGSASSSFFGVWRNPTVGESFHGRISRTFDMRGKTLNSIFTPSRWGGGLYIQGITGTNVSVSNPKIELGNVATDWYPAPEDVSPKLDIGGRNYILNSSGDTLSGWKDNLSIWSIASGTTRGNVFTSTPSVAWTGGGTNSIFQMLDKKISGKQVTVSFWAKSSVNGAKFHSEPQGGANNFNPTLTTDWAKYYYTISSFSGTIYFMGVDAGTTYYLDDIKLEVGNIATDWSPAPEDVNQNLVVGGRNYLTNSSGESLNGWTNNGTVWSVGVDATRGSVFISTPSTPWTGGSTNSLYRAVFSSLLGRPATVSFWAKASVENSQFHSESSSNSGVINPNLSTSWTRYSYYVPKFTGTIYFMGVDAGTTYYLDDIKLEAGNIATDWSPAPEDTISATTRGQILDGYDLNGYTDSYKYVINGAKNLVNYPSGASNWAALEVENINGNTATQTLKDSNSQVFIRSMGGNPAKWSAWRNVSDPGDPWQVVATAHFEAPKINSTSAGSIVYYKFGSMVLADFHRENVTFSADIDTSLNNDVTIVVDSGTIPPKDANEWMAVPIAANKVGVGVDAQARGTTLIRVRAIDGPMTPGTYVKMGTIMYHTNS